MIAEGIFNHNLCMFCRSIDIRASKMNIEAIFAQYIDLVQRFECASTTARSLNSQACEKQRSGIELQEQRYYLLTQHLQRINVRLSETYKSIVPEADCYLSYAANPISLFEEGIKLLAQHNHSAWREVSLKLRNNYRSTVVKISSNLLQIFKTFLSIGW